MNRQGSVKIATDAKRVAARHDVCRDGPRVLCQSMIEWKGNKSLRSIVRVLRNRIRLEWFAPPDEFDRRLGVETRLAVWRKRIFTNPDSVDYEAVNPLIFARAVPVVPRSTFIDLGCGKGRALILAHEAGFRDLIGVEISPKLAKATIRNLKKLNIAAEIVAADAGAYCFPDRPIVVFLYNPFGEPTMRKVTKHLREHNRAYVIYVNPQHLSLFSGFRPVYSDRLLTVLTTCEDLPTTIMRP